jgi:hypothetical protein
MWMPANNHVKTKSQLINKKRTILAASEDVIFHHRISIAGSNVNLSSEHFLEISFPVNEISGKHS